MKTEEIEYWAKMADKIISLHEFMDEVFNTINNEDCSKDNFKIAIMAGLIDAYNRVKESNE